MNTKQQLAAGATLTLGTLLLVYIYRKYTSSKTPDKPRSKPTSRSTARTLLSKYNPRPTTEDIQSDNNFQGRVVKTSQISEGGIVYHDIRYPRDEGEKSESVPESTSLSETSLVDNSVSEELSSTSASNPPTLVTNDMIDKSDSTDTGSTSVQVVSVDESELNSAPPPVVAASVAASVSSEVDIPLTSDKENTEHVAVALVENKTDKENGDSQSQSQLQTDSLPRYPSQSSSQSSSHSNKPTSSNLSDKLTANGVTGGMVTTEEFVRNVVRYVAVLTVPDLCVTSFLYFC